MAMYHAWDSQNAWLRPLHSFNVLFVHTGTARACGLEDGDDAWLESAWGRVRCTVRHSEATEPGTVWTWNAIAKAPGAWGLPRDADEARRGFLLNALITDELPSGPGPDGAASRLANADPVTGQAAWYDVRVRLRPVEDEAAAGQAGGRPGRAWRRWFARLAD